MIELIKDIGISFAIVIGCAETMKKIVRKLTKKQLEEYLSQRSIDKQQLENIVNDIKITTGKDLFKIIRYFPKAKEYNGVAGELYNGFYSDKKFITKLREGISNNDLKVRIIFGPNLYLFNQNFFDLIFEYRENFELYRVKNRIDQHFKQIITDEKIYLQVDSPHSMKSPISERAGFICSNKNPYFNEIKNTIQFLFSKYRQNATLINNDPKDIRAEFTRSKEGTFIVRDKDKIREATSEEIESVFKRY
jgi:hypothetical protein